ncbi:MAG: sigma-70 family RNA polymerase sigma factor [Polyangiaceae bacterium]
MGGWRARRVVLTGDLDRFATSRALHAPSREDHPLRDAVRAAVETALSPRQRRIVEAYFFEGLSQSDIARALGITQQVVHKALFGDVRRGVRVGGAIGKLRTALAPLAARIGATSRAGSGGRQPVYNHGD